MKTLTGLLSCSFAPALVALVGLAGAPAFAGDPVPSAPKAKTEDPSIHNERSPAGSKENHHHGKGHKAHKKHKKHHS